MSRARVTRNLSLASFAAAVALMAGCIFSPNEQPPVIEPPVVIDSAEKVITELSNAYRNRSYSRLEPLLHADYLFLLQPDPDHPEQPTDWGRTEELRIHRRMFDPQNIPPSDPPLDTNLWLVSVDITLTAGAFGERDEFYISPTNPEGLDATHWRALGADYNTSVLFHTMGETDYQVTGRAYFVVVQDLTKTPGAAGSFQLYRWQDLGASKPSAATTEPAI